MPDQERVDVAAMFSRGNFQPVLVRKGGRVYRIERVHLIHSTYRGRERLVHFSVSDGINAFRLTFSSETFEWHIDETQNL